MARKGEEETLRREIWRFRHITSAHTVLILQSVATTGVLLSLAKPGIRQEMLWRSQFSIKTNGSGVFYL